MNTEEQKEGESEKGIIKYQLSMCELLRPYVRVHLIQSRLCNCHGYLIFDETFISRWKDLLFVQSDLVTVVDQLRMTIIYGRRGQSYVMMVERTCYWC